MEGSKKTKNKSKIAAVLCRGWTPYGTQRVDTVDIAAQLPAFEPMSSQRSIQKLSLKILRTQAETEAKTKVLSRTMEELQSRKVENTALKATIEQLRGTIAKLKITALGSPKVREALSAANEANSRAESSEAALRQTETLLGDATQCLHRDEQDHQSECEVCTAHLAQQWDSWC